MNNYNNRYIGNYQTNYLFLQLEFVHLILICQDYSYEVFLTAVFCQGTILFSQLIPDLDMVKQEIF